MNRSDDNQFREVFQRLRRADEESTPAFEDVLARSCAKGTTRPTSRPLPWILAGGLAAGLLAVWLWSSGPVNRDDTPVTRITQKPVHSPTEPAPEPQVSPGEQVVDIEIDFDQLRESVDDYFRDPPTHTSVTVWSSRTESLLALKLPPLSFEDNQ